MSGADTEDDWAILGRSLAGAQHMAAYILGAYLVSLYGFWSYRRTIKAPPSGWIRLGAVLTAVLTAILLPLALATESEDIAIVSAIVLVVLVTLIWISGFAASWVREGFRAR